MGKIFPSPLQKRDLSLTKVLAALPVLYNQKKWEFEWTFRSLTLSSENQLEEPLKNPAARWATKNKKSEAKPQAKNSDGDDDPFQKQRQREVKSGLRGTRGDLPPWG